MSSFLSYLLFYLVPLIGGVAVYLAMPGRRDVSRAAPIVLGAIAVGAMIGVLTRQMGHSLVLFYVLAGLAVIGAARVVTHRKPVYSAVYFILLVVSVAGVAILAGAEFLAAALIIVYAGAILVTYVFVIMLAQQPTPAEYDVEAREPLFAVLAGFVLIACLSAVMVTSYGEVVRGVKAAESAAASGQVVEAAQGSATDVDWRRSNTLKLGAELLTTYAVAFEAAGVLLLVGIIAGIALATRRHLGVAEHSGERM